MSECVGIVSSEECARKLWCGREKRGVFGNLRIISSLDSREGGQCDKESCTSQERLQGKGRSSDDDDESVLSESGKGWGWSVRETRDVWEQGSEELSIPSPQCQ